jgi:hypothetical protein
LEPPAIPGRFSVLWIYGVEGEEVLAFTAFGIQNLGDIIRLYKKLVPGS